MPLAFNSRPVNGGARRTRTLTLLVGGEEDAEAALPAGLVRPHADDAQRGDQHDVVGHRGAELALQVLHRAATRRGFEP